MEDRDTGTLPLDTESMIQQLRQLRVLRWGPDTIYFSFHQQVSQDCYFQLLEEKKTAQRVRKERRASYCSEWLDAEVMPNGASGYGVIINKADKWSVKVQRDNPRAPGVYVEMRSKFLHTHPEGPRAACQEAMAWVRGLLFADRSEDIQAKIAYGEEHLSRFDEHLDWQGGWHPTFIAGEDQQFIKPARTKWEKKMEGDKCTGYVFGKNRVMARIYNKTEESKLRQKKEEEMLLIQLIAGDAYDPEEDVWRIEFQLKNEGLQGFHIKTTQDAYIDDDDEILAEMEGEDLPSLTTIEKALAWSGRIFQYMTTRWLRLAVPNGDTNKARWPVHPDWHIIQQAYTTPYNATIDEEQCQLVREAKHTGRRRLIERIAIGVTTTAYLMLESDPTQAVRAFTEQMERYAQKMAAYQEFKRVNRRKRVNDEREKAYWENVEHLAHMAGGMFATAGVLKQDLPVIGDMPDLILHIADELDKMAQYKGGVPQMVYDKWCREYKVMPSRKLFPAVA